MPFSPAQFLSNINAHDGPAKSNRFEVMIPIPAGIGTVGTSGTFNLGAIVDAVRDPIGAIKDYTSIFGPKDAIADSSPGVSRWLALQCEQAELPGKSILTMDQKIYGPSYKIPYQTQFSDTSLNFIATNEFFERKLFEMWMNSIMSPNTNNLRFPRGQDGYYTNITIIQYDDLIRKIYSVKLIDAFPIAVAPMVLSWSDESFHRVSVNFAYTRYEVLYDAEFDLAGAASAIFGSAGAKLFTLGSNAVSGAINSVTGGILPSLGRLLF